MSLYRHTRPLLELASHSGDDHVGRTWLVMPSDADPTPDHALALRLWVQPAPAPVAEPPVDPCADVPAEVPNGRDAPPVCVVVETSVDKVTWSRAHPPIAVRDGVTLTRTVILGPYVRARTLGNGVAHGLAVHLLANGAFRLERV